MGGVGEMVVNMIRSMLGMVWSIVTLFVVPAMVYHDLGPVDAIKKSTETIRATWGESLIRHYGMGLIQALFFFLGLGLTAGLLVVLAGLLDTTGTIIAVAFGAVYFLGLVLVFNCANTVFNTALYAFAQDGKAPQGFDTELLQGTFTRTG
jgi:hypothetical protein